MKKDVNLQRLDVNMNIFLGVYIQDYFKYQGEHEFDL